MAGNPGESLAGQNRNWADLMGAYRFFNNESVEPAAIAQPHWQLTRQRCRKHRLVLCVQDTSEMDYSGYRGKKGLGSISRENGQGFLQHTVLAVLPGGQLLGALHQRWQVRVDAAKGETRRQRRERWSEGQLWADAVEAVGPAPDKTRFITVCDRGGDSFATMQACEKMNHGFLIRAQHNRCVYSQEGKPAVYLWDWMQRQPLLKTIQVKVKARSAKRVGNKGLGIKHQPARIATVQVRSATVLLDAPRGDPRHPQPRQVNVVFAREINPPDDASEPIDWMLLSSEPVATTRQALRLIGLYRRRWVIEEYHKVQKSGCNLEHSQLEDAQALRRLAALVGVLAVRMLWLRDLANTHLSKTKPASGKRPPDSQQPAVLQKLMPPLWIKIAARLAGLGKPETLTAQQFWRVIALRGGWLGRKHDSRPGWKVLWRGWHELALLVQGAELLLQAG